MKYIIIKTAKCDSNIFNHNKEPGEQISYYGVPLCTSNINDLYQKIAKRYPDLLSRDCGCKYNIVELD